MGFRHREFAARKKTAKEFATTSEKSKQLGQTFRGWARLLFCALLICIFMFVLAPLLQRLSMVNALAKYIEDSGIDASALYYTGVEETAEAEMYLHNADKYAPGKL